MVKEKVAFEFNFHCAYKELKRSGYKGISFLARAFHCAYKELKHNRSPKMEYGLFPFHCAYKELKLSFILFAAQSGQLSLRL